MDLEELQALIEMARRAATPAERLWLRALVARLNEITQENANGRVQESAEVA